MSWKKQYQFFFYNFYKKRIDIAWRLY